jgi:hypothetical protein
MFFILQAFATISLTDTPKLSTCGYENIAFRAALWLRVLLQDCRQLYRHSSFFVLLIFL